METYTITHEISRSKDGSRREVVIHTHKRTSDGKNPIIRSETQHQRKGFHF